MFTKWHNMRLETPMLPDAWHFHPAPADLNLPGVHPTLFGTQKPEINLNKLAPNPHWRLQFMPFDSKRLSRGVSTSALIAILAIPHHMFAQAPEHLVSPTDLREAVVDASRTRQQNLDTLKLFFSSDKARQALQTSHIDLQQVKSAVASLNDEELAQLASRANKAQRDFAAGTLGDRDLLLILVAIAVLILIIVAVR